MQGSRLNLSRATFTKASESSSGLGLNQFPAKNLASCLMSGLPSCSGGERKGQVRVWEGSGWGVPGVLLSLHWWRGEGGGGAVSELLLLLLSRMIWSRTLFDAFSVELEED